METEWKWSPKRRKAAKLIAEGELSYEQVATECGVSYVTIWKWRKSPQFDNYVHELEEAISTEAKRYLHRHALAAAQRLVQLSVSGKPADRVRLQATVEVLDRSGVVSIKGLEVEGKGQPIVAILPATGAGAMSDESTLGTA